MEERTSFQLQQTDRGLELTDGRIGICADFTKMLGRLRPDRLGRELLVRAAKGKKAYDPEHRTAVDATAGLGEDSLLLAAAGWEVTLFERDPVIAALLKDALERAGRDSLLSDIAARIHFTEGDSIAVMPALVPSPDLILLDPMFPQRQKSGLAKKKFQLLKQLERPCEDETALLEAALAAHPRKIVIKRPANGPFLAGQRPDYSLNGNTIRYDVIIRKEEI